ncbi:salivary glue protein Sgs-3-like [Daphnia carinata]|uniref:salivary glue protein Sgs-3-like n=1 Tax=Daphnia carinata TaxID=120202 RepID=UPI002580F5E5|nr:salivary glue protein Sgs-3-like [Daphnia carinata]XP_057370692.1 salivary glue protein Sgs-3-like [Daphnia carinata]
MTKPLLVVVALVCLHGWNVASAMPQQSFKSFWLEDTTLNHEPDYRNNALCTGQPDGFYPDEGCTANYYACIEQIYYPQVCPNGVIFDPALLKCVSPDTASCITTIPPTTTTTIKPFSCPADGYYPVAACSSSYYICIGTDVYPQMCPGGGVFEPSLSTCVSASTAPCKATTTTSTTTTTTTTTLTPFTCTADGFYEIAPCMQTYYICVGGVEYPESCPGTGIFVGPPTSACKRPEDTTCFLTTELPTTEALTTEPTTTEPTTTEPTTTEPTTTEPTTTEPTTTEPTTTEPTTTEPTTTEPTTTEPTTTEPTTTEPTTTEPTTTEPTTTEPTTTEPTTTEPTTTEPTTTEPTTTEPTTTEPTTTEPTTTGPPITPPPTTVTSTPAGPTPACTCPNGVSTCYQPLRPDICIQDYYTCFNGNLYPQSCSYPNVFDPVLSGCTGPSYASCSKTTTATSSP